MVGRGDRTRWPRRSATGKPILLSVGYAACHWCHVMAHESFEDADTAAVMNELFVNIKVDREERPDIDQIYMSALHHLGEQGGWPLTMFLTPKGEPVWGGTYFPKTSRYGRPAFVDVLREVSRLFREEPDKIGQNRDALMERLASAGAAGRQGRDRHGRARPAGPADRRRVRSDPRRPARRAEIPQCGDATNCSGGPGCAAATSAFFELIEHTLERICEGGIYDHLGGGFSRYSVDERWLVPHFEKMLYDNAQLLELLALAYGAQRQSAVPRSARPRRSAGSTREMTTPEGAFSRLARCRFGGRGGQVLRLVEGRGRRGAGRRKMLRFLCSITT